jgi:hypothetical protein
MAVDYTALADQLGAELQTLRGVEAAWEWQTKVSGASTFFRDKINAAYDNTKQLDDDTETASKAALAIGVATPLASAHGTRLSDFENFFFAALDQILSTTPEDQIGAIAYTYDSNLLADGEVKIENRTGRWAALRAQMVADVESIRQNIVAAGAFTGDSGNLGVLTSSAFQGEDHLLQGEIVFQVTDDTVGAVFLSVVNNLASTLINGDLTRVADNAIKVGKSFEDGITGLTIKLDLGPVAKTGDDGTIFSTVPVITNPSENDSAKGQHFIEVERLAVGGGGPHFKVRWFRSGTMAAADLVTEIDVTGETGTEVIALQGSGSSISVTFDKDAAVIKLPAVPNKDSDIVFDIKSPRIGDKYRLPVTNDESGNFATKIARRWPASLNSVANPGQTFDDTKAASIAQT